jgi:lipopolysaccharide/colanic/teichoic acid biosynthesis glycosyltransferase
MLKELAERTLAAVALVVLSPLLIAIAVLIRIDSPGPAIFRQVRAGKHGLSFSMLKFRTMSEDAEALRPELEHLSSPGCLLFKLRDDPRITRVGRVLRRYSLDELPQLVNVLRGQMALVGPRPPLLEEVEQYEPDVLRRLAVKPGITGLWQVSGRSDLSWEESVRLDLRYVDNWSLGRDAAIVARTFGAVLGHRGAY